MKKIWKVVFVFICCCAASLAQVKVPVRESGFSDQYKSENTLSEYTFGYNEDHSTGGSFRRETSDRLGNKFGSYGLRIGDGRVRVVNYVADRNGFRADVISNEPGVVSQNSNPFSKITKKGLFAVLVPGFRYSSVAPHVTFEKVLPQTGGFRNGGGDRSNVQLLHSFEGEGMTGSYAGEVNNPTGGFPNEGFHEAYPEHQQDPSNDYTGRNELHEDSFLEGQYSHDSERIAANESSGVQLEQRANDVRMHSTSISKQTDVEARSRKNNHGIQYRPESAVAFDDLSSFQSTIVTSKETLTSADKKNATLLEGISKNATVAEA